ncbi:MAG: DUF4097 family beta strand repeat protein [Acidobacteria bacterium]|nr:DUF4097 family beta strand repeat protein [Acidobacteriota bacterium]
MKALRRLLGLVLALALPFAAACDIVGGFERETETEPWSRTYPLAAGGQLEVSNVNGRIQLTGGETDRVEIRAEKIGKGATPDAAREMLKRIEIRESVAADRVRIETKLNRSGGLNMGNGEVRYTIRVPAGANVKLETVNGGIEVDNVRGRTELETTNGGIVARRIAGGLDASTTNGGVEAELEALNADGVQMECTNGGLRLRLPRDARADVSARITNGGISVEGIQLETIGEQSRRRLEGRLNGGGARIRLEGTNGGIRIHGK